jgi:hypothetical protein
MSVVWCRSCGAEDAGTGVACASCGVSLEASTISESLVGLAVEVPGKLRVNKRLGICIDVDGESAVVHLSPKPKDTITLPATSLASPSAAIPPSLSPATRFIYASRQPHGRIKASWDTAVLLERAGELAAISMGAMRMVADEALTFAWPDIVAWTTLTDTEKAWRRAHHAAGIGDLDALAADLQLLPPSGYVGRIELLLPHLPAVATYEACRTLVAEWARADIPGADLVDRLLSGNPNDALEAGMERLTTVAAPNRESWADATAALAAGVPQTPLRDDCPSWEAAALVTRARAGENMDASFPRVATVAPAIIDDLIDAGALTADLVLDDVETPLRPYVLARLRPGDLDDDELIAQGHYTELARRYCRRHERGRLDALPASPGVAHYQALLDVVEGKLPDPDRLRPESIELLELVARTSAALKDKATTSLPRPVVDDPTLWATFSEHARSGQLAPDADTRAAAPLLGHWYDLQRLVGLLWQERWVDAVTLGEKLVASLDRERQEDEVLSLTAYALLRLGRGDEAIAMLERAMAGSYTEALLVNLSIAASGAKPEIAAAHFARIVNEAPTHDLQIAALRRAVEVWNQMDHAPTFPPELLDPLRVVLSGECSVEDYATLSALAASVAPKVVLKLSNPGGERAPIYRLQRARARFQEERAFGLKELTLEFIAVHEEVGRPPWFNAEWTDFVSWLRQSVFVKFGEAMGSAVVIDTVVLNAFDLFTQHERFVLLPQAGAHLAVGFVETDDVLSDQAMRKFFYLPIEEFLAERSNLDPGTLDFIADNFRRTLFMAGMSYMETMRDNLAGPYNDLVQRLKWDRENRYAILARMRSILDDSAQHQEEVDRVLDRLRRLPAGTDDEVDPVKITAEALSEWRAETVRLRANL